MADTRIIKDAVQPDDWSAALPRKAYGDLRRIDVADGWFEVYALPHAVYALYEPGHFQEVISFLICGSDRALLLDTGLGIGNIQRVVARLTDRPVAVVNSHAHFDHVGGNHLFSRVHLFDDPWAVRRLRTGYPGEWLRGHLSGDAVCRQYPEGFDPQQYRIPPVAPLPLHHGDVFDLGNRRLEVLHTPGHTPDSIMLLDRACGALFTGDTVYPAALYAHFRDEYYGNSDFGIYCATLERLAGMIPDLDRLYCSHNEPLMPPALLADMARAFGRIRCGSAGFEIDRQGLRRYDFKGFAVVLPHTATR